MRRKDDSPPAAIGWVALPAALRRPRLWPALGAALAVVALLAAIGAFAAPRAIDLVQSLSDEEQDASFLPSGRGGGPDTPPPAGLQRGSLVRRGNLVPALRRLEQRSGGGRVRMLRIAPDRIDAQVVTAERRLRTLRHRHTGETVVLSDTSVAASSAGATFAWDEIDASAPRRIIQRAVRGGSSRDLSSVVLHDAGARAGLQWSAFLAGGVGFTADAEGRRVRRIP